MFVGARRLILLKSVTVPAALSWEEAARQGVVDPYFPRVLRDAPQLEVRVVNFRAVQGIAPL